MQAETLCENYRTRQKVKWPVSELSTRVGHLIKKTICKEGYLTYEIQGRRVFTNGASFLGKLYEVDVKGTTKDGDKETNLFLKINNEEENKQNWISLADVYRKELFAYRELFVIFTKLQEDADVPPHERYKIVKSYEDSSTEVIIFENLARKGFKMYDRAIVVPLDLAEMSIKELAKFHGLSFALQQKRPDYFNTKIKEMKHPIIFGDDFFRFVKNMINFTIKDIDNAVKSRVERVYYKLANKYEQFFEDKATKRCICHGDYRLSNMMIKNNNGKVIDFIAVDYQTLYYGCPTMDIIYFIFLNTDQQFRKAHLPHLKDLYHETLTKILGYFNIDVDLVYSREMFEQDFKAKLDYGLLVGFVFLPLALANRVLDVNEVSGNSLQISDMYRKRQRGMINEFIEWGYI